MSYFSSNNKVANTAVPAVNQFQEQEIQRFPIVFFNNERDNIPRPKEPTWSEFIETFGKHVIRTKKEGSPAWSPVCYKAGSTRGNANVESISMLVADIDDGTALEEVKAKLDGYRHLIHSSFSHTLEQPKYRVIVPMGQSVPVAGWPLIWARFNALLGGINDASTKDSARIYYMPCHTKEALGHFVDIGEGKLFDTNALPELPVETATAVTRSSNKNYSKVIIDGIEEIPADPLGPNVQLIQVQQRCQFIQSVSAESHQPQVTEPVWTSMISNLCRFEGGEDAIHSASCHHPEYDESRTDYKIERCLSGSAPITCQRIQALGFSGCPTGGCKLPSGSVTKAPAGLGVWANGTKNKSTTKTVAVRKAALPDQVKAFLFECFPAGLVYFNNSFHAYQGGYWPSLDEQAEVRNCIANFMGEEATPHKISNMLTLARDFQSKLNDHIQPDRNLICLSNGTLNTLTSELIEHNPDHNLRTKTDIEWNPDASCDRFMQFLDEIFVNDNDKAEKTAFIQEWLGYCLIPDNRQHKFLWMIGSGGNGKSKLLEVIEHLVGKKNVTNAAIEDLGKTFVRAELEGKLVNISSEMSASATMADSYLKAIVSGDTVQAERKYQPSFSFKPFVKLIAATNHLPRLLDLSEGFFRRAIILSFNIRITEENKDPYLDQKLVAELPGILVWAVKGLERLRNNDRFTVLPSSVQELEKYRDESDTEKSFADECLERVNQGGLPPVSIYEGYVEWCKKNGFHAKNKFGFGHRLKELGYTQRRSGGKDYWLVTAKEDNGYFNDYFVTQAAEDAKARNTIKLMGL